MLSGFECLYKVTGSVEAHLHGDAFYLHISKAEQTFCLVETS